MVLVVLFPLPDEKNVGDAKTIFTCSQTCLLEMKPAADQVPGATRSRFRPEVFFDGTATSEAAT